MKGIWEYLFVFGFKHISDIVWKYINGYITRFNIAITLRLRLIYILTIITGLGFIFFLAGFLLLHFALFLYLDWTPQQEALLMFILGMCYILFFVISIIVLISTKKKWIQKSGAQTLAKEVANKD